MPHVFLFNCILQAVDECDERAFGVLAFPLFQGSFITGKIIIQPVFQYNT